MNKRIEQLSYMLSYITGKNIEESRNIIENTETGQEILKGNQLLLYEQQTTNLSDISRELIKKRNYKNLISVLTNENIIKAGKDLKVHEKNEKHTIKLQYNNIVLYDKNIKEKHRTKLKSTQKRLLKIKQHEFINEGRINHAY